MSSNSTHLRRSGGVLARRIGVLALAGWATLSAASGADPALASKAPPHVVGHLTIAQVDGLAAGLAALYEGVGMAGLIDAARLRDALLVPAPAPLRRVGIDGAVTVMLVEAGQPSLDVVWVVDQDALGAEEKPELETGSEPDPEGPFRATSPKKRRVVFAAREELVPFLTAAADALVDPPTDPGVVTFGLDVAALLASRGVLLDAQIKGYRFSARTSRFLRRDDRDAEQSADVMTVVLALARAISSLAGSVRLDRSAFHCDLRVAPVEGGGFAEFVETPTLSEPALDPPRSAWSPGEFARVVVTGGTDRVVSWVASLDLRAIDLDAIDFGEIDSAENGDGVAAAPSSPPWMVSAFGLDPSAPTIDALWRSTEAGVEVRLGAASSTSSARSSEPSSTQTRSSHVAGLWVRPIQWLGPFSAGPTVSASSDAEARLLLEVDVGTLSLTAHVPIEFLAACMPVLEVR